MAEAEPTPITEPVLWAVAADQRYPFIQQVDLTGRQLDWIERQCGKSIEDASEENLHVFTRAYVAVCIADAAPSKKLGEVFAELADLKVSEVGIIAEYPAPAETPAEAGPTKPARTRAKSADSGSQK